MSVARRLGIEHHVFNFGDDFDEHVVAPYVADHAAGRTPNPCIECNRHLKFDRLLRRADALGFDAVATGHHARIVELPDGVATHRARGRRREGPVLRRARRLARRPRPGAVPRRSPHQARRAGRGGPARAADRRQARQPGRVLHHRHGRALDVPRRSHRDPPRARRRPRRHRRRLGSRRRARHPRPAPGPRTRRGHRPALRGRRRRTDGHGHGRLRGRPAGRPSDAHRADLGGSRRTPVR